MMYLWDEFTAVKLDFSNNNLYCGAAKEAAISVGSRGFGVTGQYTDPTLPIITQDKSQVSSSFTPNSPFLG